MCTLYSLPAVALHLLFAKECETCQRHPSCLYLMHFLCSAALVWYCGRYRLLKSKQSSGKFHGVTSQTYSCAGVSLAALGTQLVLSVPTLLSNACTCCPANHCSRHSRLIILCPYLDAPERCPPLLQIITGEMPTRRRLRPMKCAAKLSTCLSTRAFYVPSQHTGY